MSAIKVVCLGAGQDVGRSCLVLTIGGKNVLLDCGMHMGFEDARRFPDFTYISATEQYSDIIDAVLISHFHLDHCGSLPYFTEQCGYSGPIYMSYPTRSICPILLEDFRKIAVERRGESNFFTSQNIRDCMSKVVPMSARQTIMVDDTLQVTAYYAGHVLGAVMFEVRVGEQSVVYTGDYNMTPDRHLGSAWIGKVRPDLLITESTYCTFLRDSKRIREKEFLARVHGTVQRGGKVLIPVFALGRVQELCILIETYWQRMGLHVPVYFTAGMAARANEYYRLFLNWTNEKIKGSFMERNVFDFQHIQPWEPAYATHAGPMVLFATPGMLHAGTSLEVFKKWAGSPLNMVLIPGYCSVGTVGAQLLAGKHKTQRIELDKKNFLEVNCAVEYLSFSAHADQAGIEELIRMSEPKNVMLVHGEKNRISEFKRKVVADFGIPCFDPANGTQITIQTPQLVAVRLAGALIPDKRVRAPAYLSGAPLAADKRLRPTPPAAVEARLELGGLPGAPVAHFVPLQSQKSPSGLNETGNEAQFTPGAPLLHEVRVSGISTGGLLDRIQDLLCRDDSIYKQVALVGTRELHARSFSVSIVDASQAVLTWDQRDDSIAQRVMEQLRNEGAA